MSSKKGYHIYALTAVIFWALAYVFSRLAMQHFSPYSLGFLRYMIASVFLLFIIVLFKIKTPLTKDLPWFIACGATGFFFYMLTFNRGTAMLSSATSSVIIATTPVITALMARGVYKEKLAPYQWMAICVEFAGVMVLAFWGGGLNINKGVMWLFGAALCLSIYNILQRKITRTYSALAVSSYSIIFGTLMLSIFAKGGIAELKTAPLPQYINLMVLGILSSALGYLAWAKAIAEAESTISVSNYMFIVPFASTLFGFIFGKEIPDGSTFIGGGIIMCGVLLFFKDSFFVKSSESIDEI